MVEPLIGTVQHFGCVLTLTNSGNAGRNCNPKTALKGQSFHILPDPFRKEHRSLQANTRKHSQELVSSPSDDQVGDSGGRPHYPAHFTQRLIPNRMPPGVVYLLEVI